MIKCRYADKYQAKHRPRCNSGKCCTVCTAKWRAARSDTVERVSD
jgi:hypothetical protein